MMAQSEAQFVTFAMGEEIFAVPVEVVREILDHEHAFKIPQGPDYLLGLRDVRGQGVTTLSVIDIRPNPNQPRRHFSDEKLDELAASIARHGIIQPIVVRPFQGGYQSVAGERRWRAHCLLDQRGQLPQRFLPAQVAHRQRNGLGDAVLHDDQIGAALHGGQPHVHPHLAG